nr:class I SAM-dependent DNA methyltransferase [Plesiocystis pacifica]
MDALMSRRSAKLREVLDRLLLKDLKAICDTHGLDRKARAKATLIARILGEDDPPVVTKSKAKTKPKSKPKAQLKTARPRQGELPLGLSGGAEQVEQVNLSKLESHLWEAANILRGSPVDRTDWKSYILPLLFFKRICDAWDEEREDMLKAYDGQVFPDEFRFDVPDGCHWRVVRGATKHVGKAIRDAMRGIEQANQDKLLGVFGDASWTNKERLPDDLLKDLIEHFSKLSLGNKAVKNDVIGDAYEYLIKKFADSTNKKAGEFYTPRSVVRLMVDTLDPQEGETIYDPACGTGGMLLAAVEHVKDAGGDPRTFFGKLFGQEKNLTTASVARMNLQLHGVEEFDIRRGDTLRRPAFASAEDHSLRQFDIVLANPPFSLKNWGRDVWESDPWGRAFAGLPTDKSGDFAWVQHMVKSMAPGHGRMAVVLPQGALFRGGAEGKIRKKLLELDRIEVVIGLAPNLFYGTGLAACILVLRMTKPAARKKKVLVVDGSSLFRKGRAQNHLEPEHGAQMLSWVRAFEDVEDRARVVSLDEIEEEDWTLNISRYVLPPIGKDIPPLPEAVADFKAALARCREAEEALRREMNEGGWLA